VNLTYEVISWFSAFAFKFNSHCYVKGSPRMEGLDDVDRVTKCVCERDQGLLELVPEAGMMVAEIKFPLPSLETPADTSTSNDPEELRVERLNALVLALEAQVVDESVVCLMEKGSDDRSTFHGEARLNKYFTGMYARAPDLLHRGGGLYKLNSVVFTRIA
jgi:hypothetical protein